jgi:hypothetical protein
VLFFLGCQNHTPTLTSTKIAESKNIDSTGLISNKVKEYLKNNLQDWSIPDTSDYIKCWWSFYERNQIPYYVTTDINNDQFSDYAFILKHTNRIRLVILLGGKNSYNHWIAEDVDVPFNGKDIQIGLLIEPPSHIDCVVDNKTEQFLRLKSNGIVLTDLERKMKLYYWDNDSIKLFRLK